MNFGEQMLFENVNVVFNSGDRYGLTGPNGCSKSTFMKILQGDVEATTGHIQRPKARYPSAGPLHIRERAGH